MSTEAGKGGYNVYRFNPSKTDQNPIIDERHYIGVEALSWYLNKENNFWKKNMATATAVINLNSDEEYNTALGTFALDGGAKIAPFFNQRILKERRYRGDSVAFKVSLSVLKRDTAIGGILKSAASSSLNIVSGMIETATVAGPAKILSSAGGSLVSGIDELLKDKEIKSSEIFAISNELRSNQILGPETYLLFHRGATLDRSKITIDSRIESNSEMIIPKYNGSELKDGAWIFFRIRRSNEYPDVRPWFESRKSLKGKVRDVVENWELKLINKETALSKFELSESGDETLVDEYVKIRSIIRNDGVLTTKQAVLFLGELKSFVFSGRDAINKDDPSLFEGNSHRFLNVITGNKKDKEVENELITESKEILDYQNNILASSANKKFKLEIEDFTVNDFVSALDSMPISKDELGMIG